jgi:tetratricopeptide (TPR) repeat protein
LRLHHIVISTVVAALVSGCGNQKPEEPPKIVPAATATSTSTAAEDGSITSLLPGEDVQKLLFRREKSKQVEEQQDDDRNKRIEHKLIKNVRAAQKAHNPEGTVRAEIELGKFYRTKRRGHDAVEALERAVNLSDTLDPKNGLVAEASIQLGEAFLRLHNYEEALGVYNRAAKVLTVPNEFGETAARIDVRRAWVLRCLGRTDEANAVVAKALRSAAKDTSAYRVALLEKAIMQLDAGDKKSVEAINKQVAALPEIPIKEASFGKIFVRLCARNCRKKGQLEQQDYLEDNSEYWATAEKAALKAMHKEKEKVDTEY